MEDHVMVETDDHNVKCMRCGVYLDSLKWKDPCRPKTFTIEDGDTGDTPCGILRNVKIEQ